MRIAFYAPLKPPDHPVASGDRAMARSLIAALEQAGHAVTIASRLRSRDAGDPARQARIQAIGGRLAARYLRRVRSGAAERPDLWFTYHLYHKAPDWLGPPVAAALGIPYVVAEASYAPKQADGLWDRGHRAAADALRHAALVLAPNPADAECVRPLLADPSRLVPLKPFIETGAFRTPDRAQSRAAIGDMLDLEDGVPWLLAVAMMRDDQKRLSYHLLAEALSRIADRPWRLILAGAGPAENAVRTAFAPFGARVRWPGLLEPDRLKALYRASDLYVWPAIKEAWGVAFLEAQAAGLPVVAGRSGGVPAIVADGVTGLLAPEGDAAAFAHAVATLLDDPALRRTMGQAASEHAMREHDLIGAAAFLDRHLRALFPA
jgi:glycosyltransferase involved in cell wall biosynthesis